MTWCALAGLVGLRVDLDEDQEVDVPTVIFIEALFAESTLIVTPAAGSLTPAPGAEGSK